MLQLRLAALTCALLVVGLLSGCSVSESDDQWADASGSAPTVTRGGIQFIQGYDRGCEEAQRTGKPMMLFFTASWCTYCHQMEAEAFTLPAVVELSDRFTCVLVDADAEEAVCRMYQVEGFPTVQFVAPGGTPLNRIVGKQPGSQLVMEMHTALQAVARRVGQPVMSIRR